MANLFQIGYGGGAPKAIDYSKALDPLAQKISAKLKESKAKTDALINNMPQGVPIDKVPEQLRGQVTDFLTQNKQAYVDASKVIASGIPSTDQRYIDAISTINQVDAKFKNLSNTLEDIALKRQAALDGRDHSDGALDWEISDHEDLANGTMYDNMVIQDDGGFNYSSNDGVTKRWADYSNTFQTSGNGNAGFEAMENKALTDGDKGREFRRNRYENQFDELIKKLGTKGARDFLFADNDFIAQKTGTEVGTEEFENAKKQLVNKGNFDELKIEYKKYGVDELEKIHGLAKSNFDKMLNLRNQDSKGETFSYGFRSFKMINKALDRLRSLVKKEDGSIKLPNGRNVDWSKKDNSFIVDGTLYSVQEILDDAFDSLYTVEDVFGDYDFTLESEKTAEKKRSNKPLVPAGGSRKGIQGFLNKKGEQLGEVLTEKQD